MLMEGGVGGSVHLLKWLGLALLAVAVGACDAPGSGVSAAADRQYLRDVEQWRAQRLASLRSPDGWLSYTGSGRLKAGAYRVGSAAANDIVLPAGPAELGFLQVGKDGQASIDASTRAGAMLNGQPLQRAELIAGVAHVNEASRVQVGQSEFYLVRTGSILGWRYRDPQSPRRLAFTAIEHFPVGPEWNIRAKWNPFPAPKQAVLLTSIGTPLPAMVPGEAVFEIDGRSYRLQPVLDEGAPESQRLFFLFSDRTSGRETYGGARYLYAGLPKDGVVQLDFNRAENPPCAFTPHVVCPIAPAINRLDLAVTAGEKFQYLPQ
ncbi:MAG: DUF1684 domain-containing protein [Stenotrophomonas sp.]